MFVENRWPRLLMGALVLALTAGCSNNATSPTPTLSTETFTGTLNVLGTSSKTFTVSYALDASDASVTVTALNSVSTSAPVTTTIGIGFGSIAFDGSCTRSTQYTATAAAINQELTASGQFIQGQDRVQIFDSGTLTEPVNYTFVVKHY